jgi:hypothetical protein
MGLTIHYTLKAGDSESKARKLIHLLHQAAQDLPFKKVGEIVELTGNACEAHRYDRTDPVRSLVADALEWAEFDRRKLPHGTSSRSVEVPPINLIAFITQPGNGCDSASFGLARYPAFVQVPPDRRIPTRLGGSWRWHQFCKTQYASNPKCGGVENFLLCHLAVTALLDKAKALGLGVEVNDEGDFWSKRSVPDLVREVGAWNENIAGLFGVLQSVGGQGVQGEIQKFPNFEHLEASGFNKPELAKLRQLFAATGARFDTGPNPPSA